MGSLQAWKGLTNALPLLKPPATTATRDTVTQQHHNTRGKHIMYDVDFTPDSIEPWPTVPDSWLDEFFAAYIDCALHYTPDLFSAKSATLETMGHSLSNLAPEAAEHLRNECKEFIQWALLIHSEEILNHWSMDELGHDFWLVRNRRGNFWDTHEEYGRELTDLAHPYGRCHLWIDDDGLVWNA